MVAALYGKLLQCLELIPENNYEQTSSWSSLSSAWRKLTEGKGVRSVCDGL